MMVTTADTIQGYEIIEVKGVVYSDVVRGANFVSDFFGRIVDQIGGRSDSYEASFARGRRDSIANVIKTAQKMGANAVIGVDFKTESLGRNGTMFSFLCQGTAVKIMKASNFGQVTNTPLNN